jgi:glycosyltransferase involved in cell wall biosynthesis
MRNNKVDIIIPAYKAQKTLLRTLSSIACQSILDDIEVTIVNDACPNGDYKELVDMFSPYMKIKEIKMEENGGPGLARQYGIDNTNNEFFTCIDADDTFLGALAIEELRAGINMSPAIQCCVGTFIELHEGLQMVTHQQDMVWMFGKIYRRDFIDKYKIRFNETRANEDTGFNTKVRLLCSNNQAEVVHWINEPVYYWHEKLDSITRINNAQYSFDQSFCGWTDNMIEAIQFAKKLQPFNGYIDQWTMECMMNLYTYYIETVARNEVFAEQNWEYVKKFYHTCYKKIEDNITDEMLSVAYSSKMQTSWGDGHMIGIIPCMGVKEFFDKLKTDRYNPNDIYDIWEKLPKELVENNEKCGVCPKGYTKRPSAKLIEYKATSS